MMVSDDKSATTEVIDSVLPAFWATIVCLAIVGAAVIGSIYLWKAGLIG